MRLEDTRNSIKIGDLTELRAARCEGQPALRRRSILSSKGDDDYLPHARRLRVSQACDSLTRIAAPEHVHARLLDFLLRGPRLQALYPANFCARC
jgi:hypothetical protein